MVARSDRAGREGAAHAGTKSETGWVCCQPAGKWGARIMGSPRDEVIEGIERLLSVQFHDRSLAETALGFSATGAGEAWESPYSREHLVALGGAIMDVVGAAELCRLHPDWPMGQLTVVAARTLSRIITGRPVRLASARPAATPARDCQPGFMAWLWATAPSPTALP